MHINRRVSVGSSDANYWNNINNGNLYNSHYIPSTTQINE